MRRISLILLLLLAVIPACSRADQTNPAAPVNLKDLLASQNHPITMTLKDLSADWMRFSVSGDAAGMGGYVQMVASMFGGLSARYYTKGEVVAIGGQTYLVAYATKSKPINPRMFGGTEPPAPEKLTPDTPVYLSLLNLRTAGSLTDIHPFNMKEETEEVQPAGFLFDESRNKALNSRSLSNLKQIGLALCMYTQDYDGKFPPMANALQVKEILMPYVRNEKVFINPIDGKPYLPNPTLSDHLLKHIADSTSMVALYEDAPASDGTRGVVFADGHAKRVLEAEWPKLKKSSKIP